MPSLILVVEDEKDLACTVEYALRKDGHRTVGAATGAAALEIAARRPGPDLIVLDLMLPDITGTEVCRRLRASESEGIRTPVLMLTAKGAESDRVAGFEAGADDYVVKPFSLRELALRARALLVRSGASGSTAPLSFGRMRVDIAGQRVWVDECESTLTALEFRLLRALLSRKGAVRSREQLLDDAWGLDADVSARTVDTHVKRLRQKLGPAGSYIETLRGSGYRLCPAPEKSAV